jgi:hypothetical protein
VTVLIPRRLRIEIRCRSKQSQHRLLLLGAFGASQSRHRPRSTRRCRQRFTRTQAGLLARFGTGTGPCSARTPCGVTPSEMAYEWSSDRKSAPESGSSRTPASAVAIRMQTSKASSSRRCRNSAARSARARPPPFRRQRGRRIRSRLPGAMSRLSHVAMSRQTLGDTANDQVSPQHPRRQKIILIR